MQLDALPEAGSPVEDIDDRWEVAAASMVWDAHRMIIQTSHDLFGHRTHRAAALLATCDPALLSQSLVRATLRCSD
jgi:hypothetical protein